MKSDNPVFSYLAIMNLFDWLVCYLLKRCHEKIESEIKNSGKDTFSSKNDSQVFYLKTLSVCFMEVEISSSCCFFKKLK